MSGVSCHPGYRRGFGSTNGRNTLAELGAVLHSTCSRDITDSSVGASLVARVAARVGLWAGHCVRERCDRHVEGLHEPRACRTFIRSTGESTILPTSSVPSRVIVCLPK